MKIRQRDPAHRADRYMLLTFEEPPGNVKAGWKESHATFMHELKNLQGEKSLTHGRSKVYVSLFHATFMHELKNLRDKREPPRQLATSRQPYHRPPHHCLP